MNKINILFDSKVLIDSFYIANSGRSGVFFVALNVLQIMKGNNNFHITLTYPKEYENSVNLKKIKKESFFLKLKFIRIVEYDKNIFQEKIRKHNNNYIKLIFNYLYLKIIERKEHIFNDKYLKNTHIYISAYYVISDIFLKQKHIKNIYFLYDTIPIIFPQYFSNPVLNPLINSFNKNIYFFCISQSCKDDYLKYCGDKLDANKMFVTHISTNQQYSPNYNKQELITILKKYDVIHNPNDKYLFSLCSLEPRKNLPFTITCFLNFIKKNNIQDLYFYLGGDIWKSFEVVLTKTLEYAGDFRQKIKLLGYIDDSDANILYSNSIFFTYLSQYEGFGMPPLEAMQAGTPVITSNNSSLPEVVGDAAISLTYNDEEAVIKAFEDFYFNENLRKEYIARGLERAKMFSWEKCVGEMIKVIEGIVNY